MFIGSFHLYICKIIEKTRGYLAVSCDSVLMHFSSIVNGPIKLWMHGIQSYITAKIWDSWYMHQPNIFTIFWHSNIAKTKTEVMVSLPARWAHRYPQGRFLKLFWKNTEFVDVSLFARSSIFETNTHCIFSKILEKLVTLNLLSF